ncbi:MAG: heavy-metal-associated domain-containing protein [Caldicoprobacterales bacterium]|jgi:copper chaperone|nr:heavy-metal-associated domain-containing protein [Clostridiales bacterium]
MRKKLIIEGMSCQHCVMHVTNALKELEGIKSVEVNLEGKFAIIELSKDVDDAVLKDVIYDAGYDLIKAENV